MPESHGNIFQCPSGYLFRWGLVCPCNLDKIPRYHGTTMTSRPKPPRRRKEKVSPPLISFHLETDASHLTHNTSYARTQRKLSRQDESNRPTITRKRTVEYNIREPTVPTNNTPFPFFNLPRELRDHVYSYLTVRPNLDAATILKNQKKRTAAQLTRVRLNQRRLLNGKPVICARPNISTPILHLSVLQASKRLSSEAEECMYSHSWFAVTLSKLPSITFEAPYGWKLSRITRLQVEVEVKDMIRMNGYVDWSNFFASFPSLRRLRMIPTFHPRYYDWTHVELDNWRNTHYIFKAFFRELLVAIPVGVDLKLGPSSHTSVDFQLQGKVLSRELLQDMYSELGVLRDRYDQLCSVKNVVD